MDYKCCVFSPEGELIEITELDPTDIPAPVTITDPIEALEKENKILMAQMDAQTERADFLEECLLEMAAQVYGV